MNGPNSWVILVLVIGAAVLATAILIGMSGGKAKVVVTLPEEIEGFELVSQFDRIEPSFPGERYSMLNSFAPIPGSPFAEEVERMGVMAYVFKDRRSAAAALEKLSSTYSDAQETALKLNGHKAHFFVAVEAGQAGLIWRSGPIIYEIFITSPTKPADATALREVALTVARAILEGD